MRKNIVSAFLTVLGLFVVSALWAQEPVTRDIFQTPLIVNYDLDSTSYIYCVMVPLEYRGSQPGQPVSIPFKTTGSSATIDASTASTNPFAGLVVGDIITFNYGGSKMELVVKTRASADQITVPNAVDLSNGVRSWFYRHPTCGTTATDGWFSVREFRRFSLYFQVNKLVTNAAAGASATMECRPGGPDPKAQTIAVSSDSPTFADTGTLLTLSSQFDELDRVTAPILAYSECRVGLKLVGTDDASDATTGLDSISIYLTGEK